MPHEIVIQNLNLAFLNAEGKASLKQALDTTVENFIEPLINENYTYTIKFFDLESHNPMVTITLQPNGKINASIGEVHFVFSNISGTHNVTAQCSNFVVAQLITPQSKDPENFKEITPDETAFAEVCENFLHAKKDWEKNHPSLFFSTAEIEKMTSYPDFLGNYSENISEQKKCIALLSFFADQLIETTSQTVSTQELKTRTKILENLTVFLNYYGEGKVPSLKEIHRFRSTVAKLQSAGSSNKRLGFALAAAISGGIVIAGLVFMLSLALMPLGGIAIATAFAVLGLAGASLGIIACFNLKRSKHIAKEFYGLANKMEADRQLMGP